MAGNSSELPAAGMPGKSGQAAAMRARAVAYLANRQRFRLIEGLPWALAIAAYFAFPDRMTFGSQILLMVLFALSLDDAEEPAPVFTA